MCTSANRKRAGYFHWSPDWEALLREHYPVLSAEVIARAFGAGVKAIYQKAHALGLKKSEQFYLADASGRIQRGRTDHRLVATQFKKGLVPWNKGTKGVVGVQDACRATQFKPGSKPHNTHALGDYRVVTTKGKPYLEKKTSERKGNGSQRWTGVHRLVWEAAHGPVPPGLIVVFKPGTHTAVLELITDDKLECITRAEHARRNHPRSRSPELARLVQLKGAITRQVNRINRESNERSAA